MEERNTLNLCEADRKEIWNFFYELNEPLLSEPYPVYYLEFELDLEKLKDDLYFYAEELAETAKLNFSGYFWTIVENRGVVISKEGSLCNGTDDWPSLVVDLNYSLECCFPKNYKSIGVVEIAMYPIKFIWDMEQDEFVAIGDEEVLSWEQIVLAILSEVRRYHDVPSKD